MKKITKEDRRHIEAMKLWAANAKSRINVLGIGISCMRLQGSRNSQIVELEQEALSDALEEHNEWRTAQGYPTVKSF